MLIKFAISGLLLKQIFDGFKIQRNSSSLENFLVYLREYCRQLRRRQQQLTRRRTRRTSFCPFDFSPSGFVSSVSRLEKNSALIHHNQSNKMFSYLCDFHCLISFLLNIFRQGRLSFLVHKFLFLHVIQELMKLGQLADCPSVFVVVFSNVLQNELCFLQTSRILFAPQVKACFVGLQT